MRRGKHGILLSIHSLHCPSLHTLGPPFPPCGCRSQLQFASSSSPNDSNAPTTLPALQTKLHPVQGLQFLCFKGDCEYCIVLLSTCCRALTTSSCLHLPVFPHGFKLVLSWLVSLAVFICCGLLTTFALQRIRNIKRILQVFSSGMPTNNYSMKCILRSFTFFTLRIFTLGNCSRNLWE